MTRPERLEEQSFCYDPDFPPDVAEGMPLVAAVRKPDAKPPRVRRAIEACAALVRRRS